MWPRRTLGWSDGSIVYLAVAGVRRRMRTSDRGDKGARLVAARGQGRWQCRRDIGGGSTRMGDQTSRTSSRGIGARIVGRELIDCDGRASTLHVRGCVRATLADGCHEGCVPATVGPLSWRASQMTRRRRSASVMVSDALMGDPTTPTPPPAQYGWDRCCRPMSLPTNPPDSARRFPHLEGGGGSSCRCSLTRCNSSTAHSGSVSEVTSSPSLLNHRCFHRSPSLAPPPDPGKPASARPPTPSRRAGGPPTRVVSEQRSPRFAAVLVEAEQMAQLDGRAVPSGRWRTWWGMGAGS